MKKTRKQHYHKTKQTRKNNFDKLTKKNYFYSKPPKMININNYNILLLPIKKSKSVKVECNIYGGNYLETPNESGIAHLLEHILISSSKLCKKEKCDIFLDKHNIESNASAHDMYTNYYLKSIPNNTILMLKYLTSAILNPNITEKLLKNEKEAVRNELSMFMNDPKWKLYDTIYKNFYKPSGYKRSGDYELQLRLLDKISFSDIIKFLNKTRISECLMFTISGNFNKKTVINFFKSLPKLENKNTCLMKSVKSMEQCFTLEKKNIFVKNSKFTNTNILIYFPINLKVGNFEKPALGFLTNIFSSGLNSILLKRLRLDLNLIYSLSIDIDTNDCGTTLVISTETIDKNAKKVIYEIFKILKKYKSTLLDKNKIENTKKKWIMNINDICLTNPDAVSDYYRNQYFWQLYSKNKSIFTISHLIKKIKTLEQHTLKDIINKVFNFNTFVLAHGSKKII